MVEALAKNKHLKDVVYEMKKFLDKEEEPPFEILTKFICELKVSNMLMPAFMEGDLMGYETVTFGDDDDEYLTLFTDIEEYDLFECDDRASAMQFEFDYYLELVMDDGFDGLVIDIEGACIPLERDFLSNLDFEVDNVNELEEPYDAQKLKDIFNGISNEELLEFIRSDDRYDLERLFVELSNSRLINPLACDSSLEDKAADGIIDIGDGEGFGLRVIEDLNGTTLLSLFTDRQAMDEMENDENMNYCGQISIITTMFEYVLRNDLDGVIINENTDEYVIPRDAILQQASGIEIIAEDSKFFKAVEYAFML